MPEGLSRIFVVHTGLGPEGSRLTTNARRSWGGRAEGIFQKCSVYEIPTEGASTSSYVRLGCVNL
jgi:hypothetical protein